MAVSRGATKKRQVTREQNSGSCLQSVAACLLACLARLSNKVNREECCKGQQNRFLGKKGRVNLLALMQKGSGDSLFSLHSPVSGPTRNNTSPSSSSPMPPHTAFYLRGTDVVFCLQAGCVYVLRGKKQKKQQKEEGKRFQTDDGDGSSGRCSSRT